MRLVLSLLLCLLVCFSTHAEEKTQPVLLDKSELFTKSVLSATQQNYKQALSSAIETKNITLLKLIEWIRVTDPKSGASFPDIKRFFENNKNWPYKNVIKKNAENALMTSGSVYEIEEWFKNYPPVTAQGALLYADILFKKKEWEKALPMIHNLWIKEDLTNEEIQDLQNKFGAVLDQRDVWVKTQRLLWERNIGQVKPLLDALDLDYKKIALARIALILNEPNALRKVKQIDDDFQNDHGLIFDQLRWFRRNKKYDEASKLLFNTVTQKKEQSKWWAERAVLIRQMLFDEKIKEAYRLAKDHNLTNTSYYADAEWLAGWISLRFLKNTTQAIEHFTNMLHAVSSPVSVARAEYWLGRTYEKKSDAQLAQTWYEKAATKTTTLYGQLAFEKIPQDKKTKRTLNVTPIKQKNLETIKSNELYSAMQYLQNAKQFGLVDVFAFRLYADLVTPEDITALAYQVTSDLQRTDLTVALARRARQRGIYFDHLAYPLIDVKNNNNAEEALVLSLIRQESSFAPHVVSPAGARGLMQLMPATAKQQAQKKKKKFHVDLLNSDPLFNIDLGSAYFTELVKRFKGSYILAIASYNAGPTNVNRWIKSFGYPEKDTVKALDWIEMIPFNETRNYVLRVLENLHIYRQLFEYPENELTKWNKE